MIEINEWLMMVEKTDDSPRVVVDEWVMMINYGWFKLNNNDWVDNDKDWLMVSSGELMMVN